MVGKIGNMSGILVEGTPGKRRPHLSFSFFRLSVFIIRPSAFSVCFLPSNRDSTEGRASDSPHPPLYCPYHLWSPFRLISRRYLGGIYWGVKRPRRGTGYSSTSDAIPPYHKLSGVAIFKESEQLRLLCMIYAFSVPCPFSVRPGGRFHHKNYRGETIQLTSGVLLDNDQLDTQLLYCTIRLL